MSIDTTALDVYRDMLVDEAEAFIEDLVETYIDSTSKLLEFAEKAFDEKNEKNFTRVMHTIKSSSASLGAKKVSEIAAELETSGREGDLSNAAESLDLITKEYKKVVDDLKEMISR